MPTTVTLNWSELVHAMMVGGHRQISALMHRRQAARGQPTAAKEWEWDAHIEGACAELAVAKYLGLYWHALNPSVDPRRPSPDVGAKVQVKRRPAPRAGERRDLRLNDADLDDAPYVLAVGNAPSYALQGWILGRDGKRQQWASQGDGRPCYFVPVDQLRPMEELIHA